jgi:hypothetical protein
LVKTFSRIQSIDVGGGRDLRQQVFDGEDAERAVDQAGPALAERVGDGVGDRVLDFEADPAARFLLAEALVASALLTPARRNRLPPSARSACADFCSSCSMRSASSRCCMPMLSMAALVSVETLPIVFISPSAFCDMTLSFVSTASRAFRIASDMIYSLK